MVGGGKCFYQLKGIKLNETGREIRYKGSCSRGGLPLASVNVPSMPLYC